MLPTPASPVPLRRRKPRSFPRRQLPLLALLTTAADHPDCCLDERRTLVLMARGVAARISAIDCDAVLVSETRHAEGL